MECHTCYLVKTFSLRQLKKHFTDYSLLINGKIESIRSIWSMRIEKVQNSKAHIDASNCIGKLNFSFYKVKVSDIVDPSYSFDVDFRLPLAVFEHVEKQFQLLASEGEHVQDRGKGSRYLRSLTPL